MGLNIDIASILELPTKVQCPKCHKNVHAYFDDLDVDVPDVNPTPGVLQLTNICSNCNYELTVRAIFSYKLEIY